MVRHSGGKSKSKNQFQFKNRPIHRRTDNLKKNNRKPKTLGKKGNISKDTGLVSRSKIENETKRHASRSEELHSSDSEPDMFSQLVSCFSDPSKREAIISDEESDSEQDSKMDENTPQSDTLEENYNSKDEEEQESGNSEINLADGDDHSDTLSDNETNEACMSSVCDPFDGHVQYDLSDELFKAVSSIPQHTEETVTSWPVLGQLKIVIPKPMPSDSQVKKKIRIDDDVIYAKEGNQPHRIETFSQTNFEKACVKSQIHNNILKANHKHADMSVTEEDQLTGLQKELFTIVNNYQDFYFPERTLDNGEEVRFVYCLHTVNHILKTRLKVVHHNSRLANKQDSRGDVPDEFRDQGLIRPKVLILVPFRNSALKVVEMLASILLEEGNNNILNKKRFYDEFDSGEIAMPHKNPKPEDYERTFAGDTDDNFKIGISVTKKSLKLYADFYSADIIVASPLGLRVIVGAEGQHDRDYDFLASIELLILDQAEVIYMQNWDHLLHIWDHLHMQPRQNHGTNFARVRSWALSGRARYYRQTLVFSAYALPQITALFSRKCHNYAGKVWVINPIRSGTICQIVLQLPQVFNRIECSSATDSIDARFQYFISKVLPQYKEPMMSHTVIYVPSYFDYVRIRNYFKKEMVSFVQICEYSKDGKIARARDMFFHSSAHFLLYSERFHFFRRIRLKGIRHIVFYQPPTIPHFYSELCNLMQADKEVGEGSLNVSVLYTRYDASQLAAIVGTDRASRMLASDRPVHMFMTGE